MCKAFTHVNWWKEDVRAYHKRYLGQSTMHSMGQGVPKPGSYSRQPTIGQRCSACPIHAWHEMCYNASTGSEGGTILQEGN